MLTLAAKGVHVFLQTEVEVSPPRNIAPITNDTVPDVLAASRADFFLVIADRDLPKRSVQVRLSPAADFVTLPAADLPDAVFESWSFRLAAHHDPLAASALSMNPNIVTEAHLDRLLVTCADIPNLRRSYAALLRLVNLTHDWEHPTDDLPHLKHLLSNAPHQPPLETAKTGFLSPEAHQLRGQTYIGEHEREGGHSEVEHTVQQTSTDSSEEKFEQQPSESKTNGDIDVASQADPETISKQSEQCDPNYRALVERALQEGIKAILRVRQQKDQHSFAKIRRSDPKSDLSIIWLNRSDEVPARIIRSQLLVRSMHQRLVSAFDTIATLPVSHLSSPREVLRPTHLPSDAHRERLLREVNDLLPRVEEVGTRLTKRPKTRRRRKRFLESDPWRMYVRRAQAAAAQGKGRRRDFAGCTGDAARTLAGETWRCYACLSFNKIHVSECTACQSPCRVTKEPWLQGNNELLNKRFKDVLKAGPMQPTPWVFAPGVLPIQPLLSNGYPNGSLPVESTRRNTPPTRSPPRNEERSFLPQDMRHNPVTSRDGNGVHLRQSFNLGGRFNAALSFDDQHTSTHSDIARIPQGNGDNGASRAPIPVRTNHTPSMGPAQVSPVRLATSAPNGPSFMDVEFSRMIANGMRSHRAGEVRSNPPISGSNLPISRGPNVMKSSLDDHHLASGSNSSVRVRSFPGSEAFPSTLPFGIPPVRDSSTANFYPTSIHQEHHNQSSSIHARQSQANQQPIPKAGFSNPGLEELAKGSYEAVEESQKFPSIGRRSTSKPIAVPGSMSNGEPLQNEFTSLEALAAASDAANGGTGSATKESLRAVSAMVTSARGHSNEEPDNPPNGMYNMF